MVPAYKQTCARFSQLLVIQKKSASCRRLFSATAAVDADFSHAVIGGGVVGLAVARSLSQRDGTSTVLLERHSAVGTETSSRNSEVVHAGIYYPPSSLKTRLCIEGKGLLYDLCERHGVPHRHTGKWIVAQDDAQLEALQRIHDKCRTEIDVPVHWLGREEARRREPDVRAEKGVLESPTTGIVDSHSLMLCLLGHFEDAGGVLALTSAVTHVRPLGSGTGRGLPGSGGWELSVRDTESGEESTITAETLVNSAGLAAVEVYNMIVPETKRETMSYAKGNYFSYGGSAPKVNTLVYPAPTPGLGGLGTHLTLDMAGRIRFGPDVEWVDSPDDLVVNTSRLSQAVGEIRKYLPGIDPSHLSPDYAGIRPKLGKQGPGPLAKGFTDFVIRREDGYEGWINLLNIESPGLTSSLAAGEMVKRLLYT